MAAAIIRFLALVALMLMPIGMGAAPAMAQTAPAAAHTMSPEGHCDEMPQPDSSPEPQLGCAAMCTAIPAAEATDFGPVMRPVALRLSMVVVPFGGVEPEIATPPPRRG